MHNPEITEDLRVRRTRKMLQQAFFECTTEKGFVALTVRDITERAMVNRSTFYRHYLDKYDLLEQYINEMYVSFEDQQVIAGPNPPEVSSSLIDLLKHIQQFAGFYRVMLGMQGDPLFTQRFRHKIEKVFSLVSIRSSPNSSASLTPLLSTYCSRLLPLLDVVPSSGG